jgi:uncharacterized protein (TIGR00251 family)
VADEAVLHVRVTPRARRNALGPTEDGVLAVRLAAPPVEGAANKALVAFLAEALGVSKSVLRVESGERSPQARAHFGPHARRGRAPSRPGRRLISFASAAIWKNLLPRMTEAQR